MKAPTQKQICELLQELVLDNDLPKYGNLKTKTIKLLENIDGVGTSSSTKFDIIFEFKNGTIVYFPVTVGTPLIEKSEEKSK